jgi:antitoxin HicB
MIHSSERLKGAPRLTVRFFRESTGSEPVRDWLKGPPDAEKREIGADIKTVRFDGPSECRWSITSTVEPGRSGSGPCQATIEEDQERGMTTKATRRTNPRVGSDFDDFLREEGIDDQAEAVSVKRVLASELERNMQKAQLTKTDMAKRMGTTRAQLDRLLNPENPATTLQTLVKAAGAVGKRVKISLVSL